MALTDILNESQLLALYADNITGAITPESLRKLVTSVAPAGGALIGEAFTLAVTDAPVKYPFVSGPTHPSDLYLIDVANNQIVINASGIHLITFRFNGAWNGADDIKFEYYLNGVATGIIIEKAGSGVTDPMAISVTRWPLLVKQADVAAGKAVLDIRVGDGAGGGGFNCNVNSAQLEVAYEPLTINAVG